MKKKLMPAAALTLFGVILSGCVGPPSSEKDDKALPTFDLERFTDEAQELPPDLRLALKRDVGISGEEFLASAQFLQASAASIDYLIGEAGFQPSDVYIRGQQLFAVASSDDQRRQAASVGAIPTENPYSPPSGTSVSDTELRLASGASTAAASSAPVLEGGLPLGAAIGGAFRFVCSSGLLGYRVSDGASQVLTSGQCATDTKGPFYAAIAANAGAGTLQQGVQLGQVDETAGAAEPDGLALINVGTAVSPRATVSTWGGGQGSPTAGTPIPIRGIVTSVAVGASICKSAVQTGWTCGVVTGFSPGQAGEGMKQFENVQTNLCAADGEVGSPGVIGSLALGVLANNTWGSSCNASDQLAANPYASFIPFKGRLASQGGVDISNVTAWEPMIMVDTPVVTTKPSGASRTLSGTLSGIPAGQAPYYVHVKPSNGTEIRALVTNGRWSVTVPNQNGTFTARIAAKTGKWSTSQITSTTYTVASVSCTPSNPCVG